MSKKNISKLSMDDVMKAEDRTRSDAPEGPTLGVDFWKNAKVVYPDSPKKQITVRLDADLIEWFKQQGKGYQTRMNAVLRSYYEALKSHSDN